MVIGGGELAGAVISTCGVVSFVGVVIVVVAGGGGMAVIDFGLPGDMNKRFTVGSCCSIGSLMIPTGCVTDNDDDVCCLGDELRSIDPVFDLISWRGLCDDDGVCGIMSVLLNPMLEIFEVFLTTLGDGKLYKIQRKVE